MHDRLIIYEKQKGNDISEAQGVPWIAFKRKRIDCGYLTNNVLHKTYPKWINQTNLSKLLLILLKHIKKYENLSYSY